MAKAKRIFFTRTGVTVSNGSTAKGWIVAPKGSPNLFGPFPCKADAVRWLAVWNFSHGY